MQQVKVLRMYNKRGKLETMKYVEVSRIKNVEGLTIITNLDLFRMYNGWGATYDTWVRLPSIR